MRLPPVPTVRNLGANGDAARLVMMSEERGATLDPLAHLYVSNAGGALRTLLGDAHKHVIGTYPSWKTGLFQPYEGLGEQALIEESELRHDVVDFQTQAFRLRLMLAGTSTEWICDHVRQYSDGTVEAIEVKQHPRQMDQAYIAKILAAKDLLGRIGWRVRVRYEEEIVGSAQWQRNRGHVLAHRSAHVSECQQAALERMGAMTPTTTFALLRDALDPRPAQGTAVVHALICAARVVVDLERPIRDSSPVTIQPAPRFNSSIRFS